MLEVIALVLVAYAAIGEPVWGWIEYRRLVARRGSDPRALVRVYRILLAVQWGWTGLVLAAVAASPRLDLAAIGFRAPRGGDMVVSMSIGAALALVVSAVLLRRAARRGRPVPGQAAYSALLPRTREERWYAAAASVTAGVCEEILYRGFFIAIAVLFLDLPVEWAATAAMVVFVVAHAYQGAAGLAGVTVLGALFTIVYLGTGSLLLPIVLHALVDLRALLLVPASAPRPGAASPSSPG